MRAILVLIGAVIAVALLVGAYAASGVRPDVAGGGPAMLAGAPAQSFEAARLGGGSGALSDYRGRVVLMNLWASWCTPCREEMPDLERLYRAENPHGLIVLGIDQGESEQAAAAFVAAHGVTFPVLLDQDQRYGRVYGAIGLPTSIVVDRSGHIAKGVDGALDYADMRAAVEPLLRAGS